MPLPSIGGCCRGACRGPSSIGTGSGYLLRFPDLADFLVSSDGDLVVCHPVPGVSAATIRHLYQNQVLPLTLSRRGKLVFHASAVDAAGNALVFAGESGRGKSTLAASFATSGYPFLTDDGLVVDEAEGVYQIAPSHPSLRLWHDSQQAIVGPETRTADAASFMRKTRLPAGADIPFCDEPRRLRHVYFLGDGKEASVLIAPMTAREAFIALVKHSFLLDIQAQEFIATHFDRLSRFAARRMYSSLDYPRKYEVLPEVRRAVLEHISR